MLKTGKNAKLLSLVLILTILAATFVSCGSASKSYDAMSNSFSSGGAYDNYSPEMEAPMEKEELAYDKVESDSALSGGSGSADPLAGRKVIKTVNVSAETKNFDTTLASIEQEVMTLGGYVQSSNSYGKSYEHYSDRRASYTIRIPAEKLEDFMSTVGTLVNIVNKNSNVDDITDSYTDVESRLNALKVEEARLLELLSKGSNLSDLLTIEQRLSEVRYEIESYTARIRNYDTLIAFSTIHINISEVVDYTPEPIKNPTFGDRVGKAFSESWKDFAESWKDFAVNFVYALPSLLTCALFIAIIAFAVVIAVKKAKKKSANINNSDHKQ